MVIRAGKSVSHECVDGSLTAEQSRQEAGVTFHLTLTRLETTKAETPLAEMAMRCEITP